MGPSFEVVSRWAAAGVPLKVAFRGIDRYFERYYGKGPRRRPVRIDFCDADVMDVFDHWRRALGLAADPESGSSPFPSEADGGGDAHTVSRKRPSLPAHLERVLVRLANTRAQGTLGAASDATIERISGELAAACASSAGLRGDARRALIDRLAVLDAEMVRVLRASLDDGTRGDLARQADQELARFRHQMSPERFSRTRDAAIDQLARERCGLPILSFG
ncbi:MAG: hypothetical protein GEU82_03785 [Luteitalea sp.]|nr:hypothetical protein [Luteitalea sp.]